MRRTQIAVFTDRYPLLGPLIYVLAIQYYCVQIIVAAAWNPPYNWFRNVISDLGNTACGTYVCSPLHGLMNASFIMLGLTMTIGSLLIYQEFKENKASLIGFSLMMIAGAGTILVGLFPENTVHVLHTFGALLPFLFGNISLIVLGDSLRLPTPFRVITIGAGGVALVAFVLYVSGQYLGLHGGGMERLVAYPQAFWLIAFGAYMSRKEYRYHRK